MIKTIAVLGAGTMGHGIAHAAMAAGYQTRLYDISQTQLDFAHHELSNVYPQIGQAIKNAPSYQGAQDATMGFLRGQGYEVLPPDVNVSDLAFGAG